MGGDQERVMKGDWWWCLRAGDGWWSGKGDDKGIGGGA